MSELALKQINAKLNMLLKRDSLYSREIEGLVSHKHKLEAENKKLRLIIYRNIEATHTNADRGIINDIIAEFEPNTPDGG